MRIAMAACLAVAVAAGLYLVVDMSRFAAWAIEAQRGFQNLMAAEIRAIKAGDPAAYAALLGATAAYGFVHALAPGHGKYLVGGVGLGTSIATLRLVGLAVASSLAQAVWAIILVYSGFFLLKASAHQFTDLAEDILAPASYAAIACVGLVIVWRGVRSLPKATSHDHNHDHADCNCHAHGPTPDEAARVGSLRDAVVLILSIAVRPCTGAIFLLVIAWQMDIAVAGAAAVFVMGLGTAALTSLVAVSSTMARRVTSTIVVLPAVHATVQIFAGTMIALISLGIFSAAI